MIRPMQSTDTPDLLALLHWMDAAPEREVFAPDARDVQELTLECEDSASFVEVDDDGVRAYCALAPFRDGLVLEGPLCEGDAKLGALLDKALAQSEGLPVYAFCARHNQVVRDALEGVGFAPMHSTAFYTAPLGKISKSARVPEGHSVAYALPIQEYRALYKAAEDAWADHLNWTPEQYDAHFNRDDVRLVALMRGGSSGNSKAVGFAELELRAEDARADLTYLAVHPAERGEGYGRILLALAGAEAQAFPELRTLRVRAHDHMQAARTLYAHMGFTHARSIVTYLKDGDEEA